MNNTNNIKQTTISYDLSNIHNYKSSLEDSTIDILHKYNAIVIEYLHFINENTNYKNIHFKNYIIINGLKTISHVFSMLLFYSKNTNFALYHSKNAYFLYIEFVGQIAEDKNSFLQLTPRDASLFVYKKSLFSIREDQIKQILKKPLNECSKKKLDIVKSNICILNHFITFFVEKNAEDVTNMILNVNMLLKNIDVINNEKNYNTTQKSFKTLLKFIELIRTKNISIQQFCQTIEIFVKKYVKKINDHYKSSTQNNIDATIMDKLTNIDFNEEGKDMFSETFDVNMLDFLFSV